MQQQIKQRNSSIELLRIISILMIVIYHFAAREYGLYEVVSLAVTQQNLFEEIIVLTFGKLGVPIFIFITGYYGIKFRMDRFVELVVMCAVYAMVAGATSRVYGGGKFAQLAFFINNWWFAAAYLSLYLLSPGINYLVENAKKSHLILLLAFFLYIDNGTPWNHTFDFGGFYTMLMIYIGARCVRLYISENKQKALAIPVLVIALTIRIALVYACYRLDRLDRLSFINNIGNPLTFLIAGGAFLTISKLHFSSKIVNWFAGSAFAVYLLSESGFGINLFTSWFEMEQFDAMKFIFGAVGVYICCTLIDQIRKPFTNYIIKFIK